MNMLRRSVCVGLAALCWVAGCSAESDDDGRRDGTFGGTGGSFGGGPAGSGGGGTFGGGPTGGTGSGGTGPVGGTGGACARVNVNASRVIPTVQLVIDGSGSMDEGFGGTSRWNAVRDALLSDNGVVRRLEGVVEFGMSIYQTGDLAGGMCPALTGPAPALNNFSAIEAAWLPEPGGATPTAEAMEAVVASMSERLVAPDAMIGPQIIILATDGAPNGCGGAGADWALLIGCFINPNDPACAMLNMQLANDGYVRTLEAAYEAQAKGIRVYVLDISDGGLNQAELQKVANVGVGLPEDAQPPAQLFVPTDPDTLSMALETIIGGAATCTLALEGQLTNTAAACSASSSVTLNGEALTCGDPNGWQVVDASTIELLGTACMNWLNNTDAMLNAAFPCDVVVPD